MFFVCPLGEAPAGEGAVTGPEVAARLMFEGQPSGSLTLRLTSTAARSIAADFLGEEPDTLPDRRIEEVVCEMANVICGSFLSRVESATTFRLATPRIVASSEDRIAPPGAIVHAVEISNGALSVMVNTERHTCQEPAESVF